MAFPLEKSRPAGNFKISSSNEGLAENALWTPPSPGSGGPLARMSGTRGLAFVTTHPLLCLHAPPPHAHCGRVGSLPGKQGFQHLTAMDSAQTQVCPASLATHSPHLP